MDFGPIDRLAQSQRALVTWPQMKALGMSPRRLRTERDSGHIVAVHRSVYRLAGSPVTWEQLAHAAVLAGGEGTFLAGRAAVRWWDLDRFPSDVIEVVNDRGRRLRLRGVRSHETIDLPGADRSIHQGVAVTGVDRSLIDVGRYRSARQVGAMLDLAVRHGLTTYERFSGRVEALSRQGRNGIGTARIVLGDRGFGDGWAFEKAMRMLLRAAGLPDPAREFRVRIGGTTYRVDFAYPDAMVGLECDSAEWHELPFQRDYDLQRRNRIENEGLMLLHFTRRRLREDPDGVVDDIRRALVRRAGLGSGPTAVFPDA